MPQPITSPRTRGGGREPGEDLPRRERAQQHEDQIAVELGLHEARRAVAEGILENAHRGETRDQEREVVHSGLDLCAARKDLRENNHVEESGDDGCHERLKSDRLEAQHLFAEERVRSASEICPGCGSAQGVS